MHDNVWPMPYRIHTGLLLDYLLWLLLITSNMLTNTTNKYVSQTFLFVDNQRLV